MVDPYTSFLFFFLIISCLLSVWISVLLVQVFAAMAQELWRDRPW